MSKEQIKTYFEWVGFMEEYPNDNQEVLVQYKTFEYGKMKYKSNYSGWFLDNCQCWLKKFHHPVADEVEFLQYVKEAREQFCRFIAALEFSVPLRTEVDNLLICFDQMKERLSHHPVADASQPAGNEAVRLSAKEFWKSKFDEYPQNDAEKLAVAMLAVAMMAEYKEYFTT